MITIRIPVDTTDYGDNPFRQSQPDKINWHEAKYGDDGRFDHLKSLDGSPVSHQWATNTGVHGVSVIEETPYTYPVKIAVVGWHGLLSRTRDYGSREVVL